MREREESEYQYEHFSKGLRKAAVGLGQPRDPSKAMAQMGWCNNKAKQTNGPASLANGAILTNFPDRAVPTEHVLHLAVE